MDGYSLSIIAIADLPGDPRSCRLPPRVLQSTFSSAHGIISYEHTVILTWAAILFVVKPTEPIDHVAGMKVKL